MTTFLSNSSGRSERLWIVTELYYPEETSTGRILTQIAEGLAGDCEVSAVCGQPNYSQRGRKAPSTETRGGVRIRRCWATTLHKDRVLFRLLNAVTISLTIFFRLLLSVRKGDRVLVVTTPPTLPFVAAVASLIRRAHYSVLVHDVYPDVAIAAGLLKKNSWPARVMEQLMSALLRHAQSIIVLGRDMQQVLASKIPVEQHKKFQIIPNWADTDVIQPRQRSENPLLRELGIQNKVVVQYSGNMGRAHNLEDIVSAAERLTENSQIHFLLAGSGAKKRWLREQVASRRLPNATVCDQLPRERLEELLNACDVAIISFIPGMSGISVPSRMYNVLAAGKPIIAITDPDSELALMVGEEQIGWVFTPSDVEGLSQLLTQLPNRRAELSEMGLRARNAAEQKYGFNVVITAYRTWLRGPKAAVDELSKAA